MPSVFTRIIRGELPGRFVWKDDRCVAFLTVNPLRPGHTLVVPVDEIDDWLDCPPDLFDHLVGVARTIGRALEQAYQPRKVALMLAGLEVEHLHLHVSPIWRMRDTEFSGADPNPDPADLDQARDTILRALADLGHDQSLADT